MKAYMRTQLTESRRNWNKQDLGLRFLRSLKSLVSAGYMKIVLGTSLPSVKFPSRNDLNVTTE